MNRCWVIALMIFVECTSCIFVLAATQGIAGSPPDRITASCGENCTAKDRTRLPEIMHHINLVMGSDCFGQEFRARRPDTELKLYHKGLRVSRTWWGGHSTTTVMVPEDTTVDEVLRAVRTRNYSGNLTFYDHPFHMGRACAKEGQDDSPDIPIKTYCYDVVKAQDAQKAGTIIHEVSHKLGYKHFTDNDEDTLDPAHLNRTIPYSIQHAVEACWDRVKE